MSDMCKLQFVTDMAKESENVTLDQTLVTKGVHTVLHDASKGFYILGEARVWDVCMRPASASN